VDAFDADVLIYAAEPGHPLGRRVAALFPDRAPGPGDVPAGVGSVLLLPEVLTKPTRRAADDDATALAVLLARLDLRPVDHSTARLAVALGVTYDLRAGDAVHLATAVAAGAARFVTNNRKDFTRDITEIEIVYPDDLTDPASPVGEPAPVETEGDPDR
jgi:predicted nucleic acid-binding protein